MKVFVTLICPLHLLNVKAVIILAKQINLLKRNTYIYKIKVDDYLSCKIYEK